MSTLHVNKLKPAGGTTVNIESGHKITGAAGSIVTPGQVIQVVHGKLNTQYSATGTAGTFPLDNYFVVLQNKSF